MAAIASCNGGHQLAYGGDDYTERLQHVIKDHFGETTISFPVFNGTGANVVGLQAIVPRWAAVICAETAHINTDENGAPERVGGLKLLPVTAEHGKLTPALIDRQAWGWGNEHRAQPLAVSLTQATEVGSVYTSDEIAAICEHAHERGMKVHMDGTRLANAAAHLDLPLGVFTDTGVDILSLGGTKNGLLCGELVIVPDDGATSDLRFLRKMNMQLASKMRFISVQFVALLEGDLWLRSAQHANAMATRLRAAVQALPGLTLTHPTEANAVFASLPPGVADHIRTRFAFHDSNPASGEVRWMCSFDTTPGDVDALVDELREALTVSA